jgi:DNA-binding transcriptional MerR regulator
MAIVVTELSKGLRIGEAADRVGVSCRTLRYYEELGLLAPAQHAAGGARRYSEQDVARLLRIRELQELLGFNLQEIGEILRGEDQLADIRHHYRQASLTQRKAMLDEASAINDRLRFLVRAKQERLAEMLEQLEAKAARHRELRAELAAAEDEARIERPARSTGDGADVGGGPARLHRAGAVEA